LYCWLRSRIGSKKRSIRATKRTNSPIVRVSAKTSWPPTATTRRWRRPDQRHDREEQRGELGGLDRGVQVGPAEALEAADVDRLADERLGDPDAGDALGEVGVDDRDGPPRGAVGVDRAEAPEAHEEEHRHEHDEREQGQLPVGPEHQADDADQDQGIGEDAAQPLAEELVDDRDVVLDPAHDGADPAAVDVADAQRLEVAEHPVAEVEDDPVAEPGDEVELAPARQEADAEGGHEGGPEQVEHVRPAPPRHLVDRPAKEGRQQQVGRGDDDDQRQRRQRPAPVGRDEGGQPAHDPRVVRLAEEVVGVDVLHQPPPLPAPAAADTGTAGAASSWSRNWRS
jgi:hypothetical protein